MVRYKVTKDCVNCAYVLVSTLSKICLLKNINNVKYLSISNFEEKLRKHQTQNNSSLTSLVFTSVKLVQSVNHQLFYN